MSDYRFDELMRLAFTAPASSNPPSTRSRWRFEQPAFRHPGICEVDASSQSPPAHFAGDRDGVAVPQTRHALTDGFGRLKVPHQRGRRARTPIPAAENGGNRLVRQPTPPTGDHRANPGQRLVAYRQTTTRTSYFAYGTGVSVAQTRNGRNS